MHWLLVALAFVAAILAAGFADFPAGLRVLLGIGVFAVALIALLLLARYVLRLPENGAREQDAATHAVLDELVTIRTRVQNAQDQGGYPWDFNLPAIEWGQHRDTLTAFPNARRQVAAVYVKADDLNRDVHSRESNGSEVQDGDDLPGFLKTISAGERALRKRH